ncbi:MAG: toxin [Thermodesulfovibrio sp. RBG_19FT_COMBO_42_12]|nr:MAG: toxin [Thermodesulfovibrio sp. RBG_19FT_COMBO_42_12]
MKVFRWDNEKNEWLKQNRGVCFEEVVILIEREDVLEIVDHPNQNKYLGQKIATVKIGDYAYLVPYVQESDEIFLKTIIPSRKATNKYVRQQK